MLSKFNTACALFFSLVVSFFVASPAFAAVDTSAVASALDEATASGQEVGGYVIGAVVGMAVVGIILAVIRKV